MTSERPRDSIEAAIGVLTMTSDPSAAFQIVARWRDRPRPPHIRNPGSVGELMATRREFPLENGGCKHSRRKRMLECPAGREWAWVRV